MFRHTPARRAHLPLLLGVFLLCAGLLAGIAADVRAQSAAREVRVIAITGTIDLGLAPYLQRVLDEAERDGVAAVLLDIDTPGGRLDAVLQMQDALLGTSVRTIAFVDRTAFSAGALVAIASETIVMAPGSAMGAATPIDGASGETASEKVISAVRATFRSTAETRGRDPLVAEAMVDPAAEVPGLDGPTTLLTLTTEDAVAVGYADHVAATREEALAAVGLGDATIVDTSPSLAERVTRFVTDPIVASLLVTLGLLLLVGDFLTAGIGLAALAGGALLALFFWGYLLAGLAGWEEFLLILAGLLLIAVEIFIIPGFGIPGVLGLIALLGGMYLTMVGGDIQTPDDVRRAGWSVGITMLLISAGLVAIIAFLPKSARLTGMVLTAARPGVETPQSPRRRGWLRLFGGGGAIPPAPTTPPRDTTPNLAGVRGIADSDLRPAGIAEIVGRRYDVVTEGDYIAAGEPIEVLRDDGWRRVVRRLPTPTTTA